MKHDNDESNKNGDAIMKKAHEVIVDLMTGNLKSAKEFAEKYGIQTPFYRMDLSLDNETDANKRYPARQRMVRRISEYALENAEDEAYNQISNMRNAGDMNVQKKFKTRIKRIRELAIAARRATNSALREDHPEKQQTYINKAIRALSLQLKAIKLYGFQTKGDIGRMADLAESNNFNETPKGNEYEIWEVYFPAINVGDSNVNVAFFYTEEEAEAVCKESRNRKIGYDGWSKRKLKVQKSAKAFWKKEDKKQIKKALEKLTNKDRKALGLPVGKQSPKVPSNNR